jgi:hypothetical protein
MFLALKYKGRGEMVRPSKILKWAFFEFGAILFAID